MALLAMATFALRIFVAGGSWLWNDSYQYLSVAENLDGLRAISTSIVHFDMERHLGVIPAPQSTFGPGYPVAMWVLAWTGLPLVWAGMMVSMVSGAAVIPLLASAAKALRLTPAATRVSLLLMALNAEAARCSTQVGSDALFGALCLSAIVLLLGHEAPERSRRWQVPLACLLVSLACWVRYAGFFVMAALHLFALVRGSLDRRRLRIWAWSLASGDGVIGILLIRNAAVTGNWEGGHWDGSSNGLAHTLYLLGAGLYHMVLGSTALSFPFLLLALAVFGGGLSALCVVAREARQGRLSLTARRWQVALLLVVAVTYLFAMTYASLNTSISLGPRLLCPILPVVLLAIGVVGSSVAAWRPPARLGARAAALLAIPALGYAGANLLAGARAPDQARHQWVAEALRQPMPDGRGLDSWIEASIPRTSVLLAVEGQATGHYLGRRTISMVGREYSQLTWNEDEVQRTMAQFGVEFLFVYREIVRTGGADAFDSGFLWELASGRLPGWLEIAAENASVLVLRPRLAPRTRTREPGPRRGSGARDNRLGGAPRRAFCHRG